MTIRTRVRLLSAVAMLGILLFLGTGFLDQRERYRRQTTVAAQARDARHLLAVIHQLQKERGRSAIYLGEPSPANRESLLAQQASTDKVLDDEGAACASRPPLQEGLGRVRDGVLALQLGGPEAHAFYAREIEHILAGLTHVRLSSSSPDLRRNLDALVHFIYAKESLGQIRARLSLDLAAGGREKTIGYEIARHDALFAYHLREARRHAPASLAAALERLLARPPVQETLTIIARAASQEERLQISQAAWFAMATETIDLFRQAEEEAIGLFAGQAEALLGEMRLSMILHLATAATVASMVLLLAALTLRLVLRPLDILLMSVREVVESRDFSVRMPTGRDDEVGIIARGFNDLLETVDRLMHEKDYLARTDILTGAANRLAFSEALLRELARKRRHPGPLSLVLLDLDHFKRVNDTFGHDAGDEVLRTIARLVTQSVRSTDIFARWGGEEFVILAPDSSGSDVVHLAEKLRLLVEEHDFPVAGRLTASFGIADLTPEDDAETLVKRADMALYRAKEGGRNRVVVADGGRPVWTAGKFSA